MTHSNLPPAPATSQGRRKYPPSHLPTPAQSASHGAMGAAASSPALLLACGNSLRQDDAVGLRIAEAAEQLLPASRLRIVAAQQFTPEMAADLAQTELVIFVDASSADEPGAIRCTAVVASPKSDQSDNAASHGADAQGNEWHSLASHHLDPGQLLALAQTVCGHAPANAFVLTVGASHFGYGEDLSGPLRQAVPRAVRLVNCLVAEFAKSA